MQQSFDNLYRAPQARLQNQLDEYGVTSVMADTLASAGIWARLTSILCFIAVVFMLFLAAGLLMGFGNLSSLGSKYPDSYLLGFGIFWVFLLAVNLAFCWVWGHSMHRYAGAAKALRYDADEEYAEQCFFYSSRVFKLLGISFIAYFSLIFLAILIPVFIGGR